MLHGSHIASQYSVIQDPSHGTLKFPFSIGFEQSLWTQPPKLPSPPGQHEAQSGSQDGNVF